MNEGLVSARVKYWPDKDIEIFDDGLYRSFSYISAADPIYISNAPYNNANNVKRYRAISNNFRLQPDISAAAGNSITVKCEPVYSGTYSYSWYKKAASDTYFSAISGATGATYTTTVTAADDGMQLICFVYQDGTYNVFDKPITVHLS